MAKQTPKQRKTLPKSPSSKLDQIVSALRAPKGATIAQLVALTGWQAHSVRGRCPARSRNSAAAK